MKQLTDTVRARNKQEIYDIKLRCKLSIVFTKLKGLTGPFVEIACCTVGVDIVMRFSIPPIKPPWALSQLHTFFRAALSGVLTLYSVLR